MDADKLRPLLEKALKAERDGYGLYSMAAERAEDPGAKEMFERLASDEKAHFEALQKQFSSLQSGSGWRDDIDLEPGWNPEALDEIFSPAFRERIHEKHLEVSALSIGLLLERSAIEFYSELANNVDDASTRGFFQRLAAWEDGHYQLLLRLDEDLKEDYWAKNRFAPLL